jgi:hypothetical protein
MRINLDIASDASIRKDIREMIEGQVKAIVKDEMVGLVRAEIVRCLETRRELSVPVINEKIRSFIVDRCDKFNIYDLVKEELKKGIDESVKYYIGVAVKSAVERDFNEIVAHSVQTKVDSMQYEFVLKNVDEPGE